MGNSGSLVEDYGFASEPKIDAASCDHDQIPYVSLPRSYTQPGCLAAAAKLHGLNFPDPVTASVLELGCGTGGNLVPLAARYRDARFHGVDISANHIALGQERVSALNLSNVVLQQGDIGAIEFAGGSFDYVICHGVFSWVDRALQSRILELISASLSENGVAAISYNVLPGWHMRLPVREYLIECVGAEPDPIKRVDKARKALLRISESVTPSSHYGRVLLEEANLLSRMPSSYILGEFLARENQPMRFHDFAQMAGGHGLSYVCEADFNGALLERLRMDAWQRLTRVPRHERFEAEQDLDNLTGRPFRRSLLVKSASASSISSASPEHLTDLHIAAKVTVAPELSKPGEAAFILGRDRQVSTRNPAIANAFSMLGQVRPGSVAVERLTPDGDEAKSVLSALLRLVCEGQAIVSAVPLAGASPVSDRPKLWHMAQIEAESTQPWLTSQAHTAIFLPSDARLIARRFDGGTTVDSLTEWVVQQVEAGLLTLTGSPGEAPAGAEQMRQTASELVRRTVQHLARSAVLVS